MNNILDNDIPKYKKKKNSSTSKSKEKSKHKHEYKDCLLITTKEKKTPYKASYCVICGKINNQQLFETVPCENGYLRMLNAEEIYEKYKDLEKVYVDDIWQKYVSISKEDK